MKEELIENNEIQEYWTIEDYKNAGKLHHKQGNYEKAIECWQKILEMQKVEPVTRARTFYRMGESYFKLECYSDAIECFTEIENINDLKISLYAKAYCAKAISEVKRAGVFKQENNAKSAEKSYQKAIIYFNKAIQKDGSLIIASYKLGCLYMELKEYEEAITCFSRKELSKEYDVVKNKIEECEKFISNKNERQQITKFANGIVNFVSLSVEKSLDQKYKEEFTVYEEDFNLIELYKVEKNYEKALKCCQKVLKRKPSDFVIADIFHHMGNIYYQAEEYEKAISCFGALTDKMNEAYVKNKQMGRTNSNLEVCEELGDCYIKINEPINALPCYQKATELYIKNKNYEKSITCGEKILKIEGLDPKIRTDTLRQIGLSYCQLKEYEKSAENFAQAGDWPNNGKMWEKAAEVYRTTDTNKFVNYYKNAICAYEKISAHEKMQECSRKILNLEISVEDIISQIKGDNSNPKSFLEKLKNSDSKEEKREVNGNYRDILNINNVSNGNGKITHNILNVNVSRSCNENNLNVTECLNDAVEYFYQCKKHTSIFILTDEYVLEEEKNRKVEIQTGSNGFKELKNNIENYASKNGLAFLLVNNPAILRKFLVNECFKLDGKKKFSIDEGCLGKEGFGQKLRSFLEKNQSLNQSK